MAEIRFEFEAVGGAEVAETFEDIRVKEIGASESAKLLSEELRRIRASGQVSAQGIEALTREVVKAETQARNFANRAREMERASMQVYRAFDQAGRGARRLHGGGAEVVNMISEMSLGLGGISPQMREFTTNLAMAGNNVSQLGAVLPGPTGIIVGLGATMLPLLIAKIVEWTRATQGATRANTDLGHSAEAAAEATDKLVEAMRRQRRQERIASGFETAEEANVTAERESARLRWLRQGQEALQQVLSRRGQVLAEALEQGTREWQAARRRIAAQEQRLSEITSEIEAQTAAAQLAADRAGELMMDNLMADAGQEDEREPRRRRSRRRVDPAQRELERRLADEERFFQELQRLRDRDLDHEIRTREQVNAAIRREDEIMRREEEREQRRMRAAAEKAKREADRQLELARKEAERAIEETRQNAEHLLTPAIHNITGAVAEIVAGTKSADEAFQGLLSGFLEMLSQQAALEAAKEFAAAAGSFASYDYSGGALHLAAGAAWTGVAIAAGGAAIATAPSVAQPASPQQEERPSQPSGGQVVVNLNGAVVTAATHAELGRELSRTIAAGGRRFGVAA